MKKYSMIGMAILLTLIFIAGCTQETMDNTHSEMEEDSMEEVMDVNYMDITPEEAKELIESTPDLIIIDVSPKYDDGHLPGAINYYVGDGSLDDAISGLDKSKPYLVYCHSDSASILGATKLIEAGFSKVYRLEGNYSAWVNAGYTVEK